MISKKYESNGIAVDIQDIDLLNISTSNDNTISIEATDNCIVSFRKKENKVHIIRNQVEDMKTQITITKGKSGISAESINIGDVTGQLAIGKNIVQYSEGNIGYKRGPRAEVNISIPKHTKIFIEDVKMTVRNDKKDDGINIEIIT